MKDNFDLKGYLTENKMTTNSRGDVRHHLTEAVDLDMRLFKGKKLLNEVRIPADPDQDPYDHHDPEYDEDYFSGEGADRADAYRDAQRDAGLDECGDMDLSGDVSLEEVESSSQIPMSIKEVGETIGFYKEHYYCQRYNNSTPTTISIVYKFYGGWYKTKQDEAKKQEVSQAFEEAGWTCKWYQSATASGDGYVLCFQFKKPKSGSSDYSLNEAGYTDDEDEDPLGDVPSLADIIGSDPNAKKAAKAAQKDIDRDEKAAEKDDAAAAALDAPVDDPDPTDSEAGDAPADPAAPEAPADGGLASQIKYNPDTVQMMMDSQELESYLNSFRRPQVAVKVLNRALKAAQDEVNDSIGLNHLYLILENGFYITSRSQRGDVIAKVSADQAWRDKNFGE